jgi:hypothetical protein
MRGKGISLATENLAIQAEAFRTLAHPCCHPLALPKRRGRPPAARAHRSLHLEALPRGIRPQGERRTLVLGHRMGHRILVLAHRTLVLVHHTLVLVHRTLVPALAAPATAGAPATAAVPALAGAPEPRRTAQEQGSHTQRCGPQAGVRVGERPSCTAAQGQHRRGSGQHLAAQSLRWMAHSLGGALAPSGPAR